MDIVYDSIWGESDEGLRTSHLNNHPTHNRVQEEQEANVAQESDSHKGANEPDDTQKTELINNESILSRIRRSTHIENN